MTKPQILELKLELVTEGLQFPEGPVAMADGSVWLVEIARRTVSRVAKDGKITVVCDTGGGPNGMAVGADGALYICNNGGMAFHSADGLTMGTGPAADYVTGSIQRLDLKSGKATTVYTQCDGKRLSAPNDIVIDRQGGLWFTDLGRNTAEFHEHGGVFYARPDGSFIKRWHHHIPTPNGIGLSPDDKVLYTADSLCGRLWANDIAAPGVLIPTGDFWLPGRVVCTLPDFQILDSLAVEASGKICVATVVNGGITIFDPDGSYAFVPVPDRLTTNICFGGADYRDAWITAGSTGKLYKTRWPRPGLRLNFNA